MNTKSLILLIGLIGLSGCMQSAHVNSSFSHVENKSAIEGSIFPSDLKHVDNDDISIVLDGVIPMKEKGKMAVLSIGYMHFLNAGHSDSINTTISKALENNKYVGEVIKVPRMLMEKKVTISKIREMGARLQCENVLVYTAYNDSRYNKNIFSKDELRVNLTIEVVVVNVRTGCIPIAASSDQTGIIKENHKDFDKYEFTRRAYRKCLTKGIVEACAKINNVLSQIK